MEDAIRTLTILTLLQMQPAEVNDDLRTLLSHGVKVDGMNIHNPMDWDDCLLQAS